MPRLGVDLGHETLILRTRVTSIARQIHDDDSRPGGKPRGAAGPTMRETSLRKLGRKPAPASELSKVDVEPVNLKSSHAEPECASVRTLGDRVRGNEHVRA